MDSWLVLLSSGSSGAGSSPGWGGGGGGGVFGKVLWLEISDGMQMERLILSPRTEFSRENGISWKVDQNSQTEFPNGQVRSIC